MTRDDEARRFQLSVLTAIEAALDDPVRLVQAVQDAEDDEDALTRVAESFGVDRLHAQTLLDLKFGGLSRLKRDAIREELRVLRTPWGEPLELDLRYSGRRSAVLVLNGTEHQFRAAGPPSLQMKIHLFLHERVARPQLRPVVLTETGLEDGPRTYTIRPDGSGSAEYPDGPVAMEEHG
jgi:hypothetical protein